MILPLLWQLAKSVNPILDKFIFMIRSITVKSHFGDCFEYLSEMSIELQSLKFAGPTTIQRRLQISALGLG